MLSSGASGTAVATDLGFPQAVLSLLAAILEALRGTWAAAKERSDRDLIDTGKLQPSDIGFAQPKLVSWPPFWVRTSLQ